MKKAFQVFLILFGVTTIVIATLHVLLGPAAIPGSIPVNPTMDSEDRFYATLFAAYGVTLLWCVKNTECKSMVVYFLALTFFVGGLARLASMVAVGLPNTFFIVMTAFELLIPAFMAFMQFSKTGRAMRALAQDRIAAQLMGVNVDRYSMIGFALGALLAGLVGGLLVAITGVSSGIGGAISTKAFMMVMIGGAGVVGGAIAGGFILGMLESVEAHS